MLSCPPSVSLFTREWIEISVPPFIQYWYRSPSLRGSGLKSESVGKKFETAGVSLFTREWIEIVQFANLGYSAEGLPLYEGVDWNRKVKKCPCCRWSSPSLRGSGLKYFFHCVAQLIHRLPLYEGVDWNYFCFIRKIRNVLSPSLRGSGLKWKSLQFLPMLFGSPSLRGSGLKSKSWVLWR